MHEASAAPTSPRLRAQRIGRRVGAQPYYRIAEQTPDLLRLVSRPELNQPTARGFLALSLILGLPAIMMLVTGIVVVPRIGLAGMLLVIPGLVLGTAALVANTLGRTLRRLVNTIVIDRAAGRLSYQQQMGPKPPRQQILRLEHVLGLGISRRMVKRFPAFLGREQDLSLLELRLIDGSAWLVDSASDAAALQPTAQALAALLALPLE